MKTAFMITEVKVHAIDDVRRAHFIASSALEPRIFTDSDLTRDEYYAIRSIEKEKVPFFHVARNYRHGPQMTFDHPVIREDHFVFAPKAVQKSLGLVYEVWDDMSKEITHKRERDRIFRSSPWWKRLWRAWKKDLT